MAGIRNKDEEFWEFIKKHEVLNLQETWVEEKAWKKIETKLSKEFEWIVQHAKRDKWRGRSSGGMITGIRKGIKRLENITHVEREISIELERERTGKYYQCITKEERRG